MKRRLLFFIAVALSLCHLTPAAEVTAQLSSESVPAGQGAMLSIRIEGGRLDAEPTLPEVKDLILQPRGQSQQMQVINGRMSSSISYNYVVGSMTAGTYQIPPFSLSVDGEKIETTPLTLTVTPSSSAAPQGMGSGSTPPEPEENAEDSERYGFLTFAMVKSDRQHVYPGEIAPVRIKAYFPMGASVSLRSKPRPEGSAFTLHNLTEEPQQSTETVNGKPYRVVTWFGGLSATKAGEYPASMTLEATLQLRDRNASRQQRPAGFNDPFFDRAFGGGFFDDFFAPVVQKDITISSENPPTLEVKELPQEGRPANFTGAIGQFAFDGVAVPSSMQTGEPTQVRASISGKGNFALLKQPEPDSAKDWKSYSGQDTFTPGDAASFGGTKAFTFNLVPRTPGTEPLRLGFSFFDPDRGQYVEKKSDPIDVAVTGKALSTEVNEAATSPSAPQPDTPDLAPLRMELGPTSSYQPLTRAAWFVPTLIGCGALTILLLTLGLRARHRSDPDRVAQRAAQQAEARALAEAEAAVRQGDTGAFLQAARQALRVRLAAVDGVRAEAVTLNELEGRVDTKALELWRAADLMDYSGGTTVRGTLTEWSAALRSALDNLTSPPTAA